MAQTVSERMTKPYKLPSLPYKYNTNAY